MLCIQFKRDFFKIGKTKSVYNKTDKCFGKEMFSEQKNSGNKKRKKNDKNAERQIIAGKSAYDDRNSGSSIINCIVGK